MDQAHDDLISYPGTPSDREDLRECLPRPGTLPIEPDDDDADTIPAPPPPAVDDQTNRLLCRVARAAMGLVRIHREHGGTLSSLVSRLHIITIQVDVLEQLGDLAGLAALALALEIEVEDTEFARIEGRETSMPTIHAAPPAAELDESEYEDVDEDDWTEQDYYESEMDDRAHAAAEERWLDGGAL